jgi:hypothetical protein
MVKNLYTVLKDPSLAQTPAGLKIISSFSISYDLIAWSGSAYQIANGNSSLRPYAYKRGSRTGIRFQTNYASGEENFMIFGDTSNLNGWLNNSYYIGGSVLTGVNYLADKDGGENSDYYEFDESGTLIGKYTGLVKNDDSIRYSQSGTAVFAGLVKDENNDYYYIGESLEALKDTNVYIEKTNGLADAGEYEILPDGRVVIGASDGGLLSYGDYLANENLPAVRPEGEITTGCAVGYYTGGALQNYTVVKYGDIDSDAGCDGRDSIFVMYIINGLIDENELSPAQFRAADCNSDSIIDEDDYNILISAGLLIQTVDQSNPI